MFLSSGCQPVELEFPLLIRGRFPLRGEPAFSLEPVQSRVEGAVFDLEDVVGGPLDVPGDLMAVCATEE